MPPHHVTDSVLTLHITQACVHSVASAEARARDAEYKARATVDALQTYLRTGGGLAGGER